jgi:hypothetical protein
LSPQNPQTAKARSQLLQLLQLLQRTSRLLAVGLLTVMKVELRSSIRSGGSSLGRPELLRLKNIAIVPGALAFVAFGGWRLFARRQQIHEVGTG